MLNMYQWCSMIRVNESGPKCQRDALLTGMPSDRARDSYLNVPPSYVDCVQDRKRHRTAAKVKANMPTRSNTSLIDFGRARLGMVMSNSSRYIGVTTNLSEAIPRWKLLSTE